MCEIGAVTFVTCETIGTSVQTGAISEVIPEIFDQTDAISGVTLEIAEAIFAIFVRTGEKARPGRTCEVIVEIFAPTPAIFVTIVAT